MEGLPMVCYSTGTMNSLVHKLVKMKNCSNSTEEFSDLVQEFKKDVLSLNEDFCDNLGVPKVCMKQVRELVFEVEDWIDKKPETDMLDPSDIEEVQSFMSEIKEARERFTWYYDLLKIVPIDPDLVVVAPSNISINPQLLVEEKSCHDLLDIPRDELVKHLSDENEEMRKVVSVIGMEGLGKTTLAKDIYSELQLCRQFECRAFVSVGRRRPIREILIDILRQVKPWSEIVGSIVWNVQEIITELWGYLDTKRYFVLVDGIWSTWVWKVINCALPNNRGSRVLATTCIMDVGAYCSSYPNDLVYQMEALSKENTKKLFLSKTVTLQEEENGAGFEGGSGYIANMCGGMPLAIIVATGILLARKSEEPAELKTAGEPSYSSLKQYSTSEGMTKILHMSYAALSLPLRSCFLYLSVFPENYTIKKDRLIWLWGAEGFIQRTDKECLWVTGERYFSELIGRRLIEPVFNCDDDQAVGCTIHGVILDFIRSLSREENFGMTAAELNSGSFPCDTIRRFSLDCGNEDEADTLSRSNVHLSGMRSLIVFGDFKGRHAPTSINVSTNILSAFKLLRVLDLEDTRNLKYHHLEGIAGLVLLRYLGLGGTGISRLPENIGDLKQLETLDLRWNPLITFPSSIVRLQRLRHLLVKVHVRKILMMQELEVASNIFVDSRWSLRKFVELLRKSERLSMLGLTLSTSSPTETDLVAFLEQVVKSNLQSLSLYYDCDGNEAIPLLVDSWEKVAASGGKKFEPRRFELKMRSGGRYLNRLPPNMGSLASLTHLQIKLAEANTEDFHVLGCLTNLVLLNLISSGLTVTRSFMVSKGIFPSLKVFYFKTCDSWRGLEFEEGAMPQLQRLGRSFTASERGDQEYQDIGIEHLTCLTRVHSIINCKRATVSMDRRRKLPSENECLRYPPNPH